MKANRTSQATLHHDAKYVILCIAQPCMNKIGLSCLLTGPKYGHIGFYTYGFVVSC